MNESVYNPNNSTTEPHYLAIISEFAIDMLSLDSIEQVLWFVTKNVIGKLGFEDVVIYLYDSQKQQLVQKAAFGDKSSYEDEIVNPIEITVGHGVVGQAALTLAPVVIDDTRLFPAYIVDDKVRLSELAVPMIIDGKLFGVSTDGKILLKTIHVIVGYVFAINLLFRLLIGFIGKGHERWSKILPFKPW